MPGLLVPPARAVGPQALPRPRPALAVGDLALSPRGETLALRLGEPGPSGVVAPLRPRVDGPDAARPRRRRPRDAWLALLLATSRTILREGLPAPILAGRAIDRAVALPIPGELEANSDALARLRRLARTARALPDAGGPATDDLARDEARFLFDYLREDYPAALADLDRLAAIETDPGRRLPLLGLRGQVFAGMGDLDRARDAFAYLQADRAGPDAPGRRGDVARARSSPTRSRPTPAGPTTPSARLDLLAQGSAEGRGRRPTDHRTPTPRSRASASTSIRTPRPRPIPLPPPGFLLRRPDDRPPSRRPR